ncbi:1096_t:CDS:2, partial [Entrophospora sp. SA101]
SGEDIVNAAKGLQGTSIANLNPSKRPKKANKPLSILEGITNWSYFTWPTDEKDPNRLSKDVVKAELKKRKIEYEEKEKKVDDIDKLKSFGIQTSGLDVMYLKFPELYLYHEIMSFKFPETIQA